MTGLLLRRMPAAFRVVRNNDGKAEGYFVVFDPDAHGPDDYLFDPVMRNWTRHLEENPIPEGQSVLFLRRWLGKADGELPSPVQAACWIDVKGDYIRLRSTLRRVYCSAIATDVYGPVMQRLGFDLVPSAGVDLRSVTDPHLRKIPTSPQASSRRYVPPSLGFRGNAAPVP